MRIPSGNLGARVAALLFVNLLVCTMQGRAPHITVMEPRRSRVDQPEPTPPNPIVVDNAKSLFADDWIVERMHSVKRTLHPINKHSVESRSTYSSAIVMVTDWRTLPLPTSAA